MEILMDKSKFHAFGNAVTGKDGSDFGPSVAHFPDIRSLEFPYRQF